MSQCHLRCFSATKRLDVIQSIGMSSAADLDKLAKWIEESRLDPNDPSNADLMYLMRVSNLPSYFLHRFSRGRFKCELFFSLCAVATLSSQWFDFPSTSGWNICSRSSISFRMLTSTTQNGSSFCSSAPTKTPTSDTSRVPRLIGKSQKKYSRCIS